MSGKIVPAGNIHRQPDLASGARSRRGFSNLAPALPPVPVSIRIIHVRDDFILFLFALYLSLSSVEVRRKITRKRKAFTRAGRGLS
ncbi:MAG: hypothetical protein ACREF9_06925, partial [Opitutaceae bacterium]